MKKIEMEKHAQKNRIKKYRNIPVYFAVGLLCLMLGSSYYLSGVMARYATSPTPDGIARVAKFLITEDVSRGHNYDLGAVTIAGGEANQTIAFLNITNSSEVAVEYTITVKNESKNLPLVFYIDKNPMENTDGTFTLKTQLSPGEKADYNLNSAWNQTASSSNAADYMGMVDYISLTAEAVQID